MTMAAPSLTGAHIGDRHMDEANGWKGRDRPGAFISGINAHVGAASDFGYPPGDNANPATPERYPAIPDTLAPLRPKMAELVVVNSIGAWPDQRIKGTRPGPNRNGPNGNGKHW